MSSGAAPSGLNFVKGHGTENDFLVLPDPDGALVLTPHLVAAVCDRRAGLGADGVLRVVRTACVGVPGADPALAAVDAGGLEDAEWFMDYRNADGSIAEMCGNGVRVFAAYLVSAGLAARGPLAIGTRGGVRRVRFEDDGEVSVDMGVASVAPEEVHAIVAVDGRSWPAAPLHLPNPHAVVFVDELGHAGSLRQPPVVEPPEVFPEGVNVEFVVDEGPAHVAMRVHERGSGETRSCGTGACAVAVAARRRAGLRVGDEADRTWIVDVPGGRLRVTERADGHVELRGPAVLLASGTVDAEWLRDHT